MTTEVNCPECGSDRNVLWRSYTFRQDEHRHCWDCDHVFPAWPPAPDGLTWEPGGG